MDYIVGTITIISLVILGIVIWASNHCRAAGICCNDENNYEELP
tara:strand:+ start:2323 stop:2454 length:132 start_codon:yes stop_codon:yes gene_type:complete